LALNTKKKKATSIYSGILLRSPYCNWQGSQPNICCTSISEFSKQSSVFNPFILFEACKIVFGKLLDDITQRFGDNHRYYIAFFRHNFSFNLLISSPIFFSITQHKFGLLRSWCVQAFYLPFQLEYLFIVLLRSNERVDFYIVISKITYLNIFGYHLFSKFNRKYYAVI